MRGAPQQRLEAARRTNQVTGTVFSSPVFYADHCIQNGAGLVKVGWYSIGCVRTLTVTAGVLRTTDKGTFAGMEVAPVSQVQGPLLS